jgi:predicted nucleotidyltransferase
MKPSEALNKNRVQIRQIVASHHASNARVFGSVAKGEDTNKSDLDILIEPTNETTLFDIGAIRRKLKDLLGVTVDVLTPNSLPDHFREEVIASSVPV